MIRYNNDTDIIQIYDITNSSWIDWKNGGLQELNINILSFDEWDVEKDSVLYLYDINVDPLRITTTGNNIGYNCGVKLTSKKSFDLNGFKYLYIAGSLACTDEVAGSYSQNYANSAIYLVSEKTGQSILLKDIGVNSIEFEDYIELGEIDGKYKISITSGQKRNSRSTLTLNSLIFTNNNY